MSEVSSYLLSLLMLAGIVTLVSGWINTLLLKVTDSTKKQLVSWVVSIIIAFGTTWSDSGAITGISLLWTALAGFVVGLIANGIYDIAVVRNFMALIKAHPAKAA